MHCSQEQYRAFNTYLKRFHLCDRLRCIILFIIDDRTVPTLCNLTFVPSSREVMFLAFLFCQYLSPQRHNAPPLTYFLAAQSFQWLDQLVLSLLLFLPISNIF